jgi:hypothetical protein
MIGRQKDISTEQAPTMGLPEHSERPFDGTWYKSCSNLRQAFHQKVRRAHLLLERAAGMLDRLGISPGSLHDGSC